MSTKIFKFQARHVQFLLLFLWILLSHSVRASLSVAILAMTENKPPDPSIVTYPSWNNVDLILSAYFWGYIFPAAGQIVNHFGPKKTLIATTILGGLSHICIPVLAEILGSPAVIVCRVLQGLTQSFVLPIVHKMMSKWTPLSELAKTSSFVLSATAVASAVAMPITGLICAAPIGWPAVFYLYGGVLVFFTIPFGLYAADTPQNCRFIGKEELAFLKAECKQEETYGDCKKLKTPLKSILLSVHTWAIFLNHFGSGWGVFTLLTQIPSYLSHAMNFDIKSYGFLSALPYLVQWIATFFSGFLADKLIQKRIFTLTTVRKLMNSIYFYIAATSLLILGFLDHSQKIFATFLLTTGVGVCAFSYSGFLLNPADLSPNFSAVIVGISGAIGNIAAILGPLSLQYLGGDKDDLNTWQAVFWVSAGIYVAAGTFYVLFGTAEKQTWDDTR